MLFLHQINGSSMLLLLKSKNWTISFKGQSLLSIFDYLILLMKLLNVIERMTISLHTCNGSFKEIMEILT